MIAMAQQPKCQHRCQRAERYGDVAIDGKAFVIDLKRVEIFGPLPIDRIGVRRCEKRIGIDPCKANEDANAYGDLNARDDHHRCHVEINLINPFGQLLILGRGKDFVHRPDEDKPSAATAQNEQC